MEACTDSAQETQAGSKYDATEGITPPQSVSLAQKEFTSLTPVQPESRADARAKIHASIHSYERAIQDLRADLNALTPIGRLPLELQAEILVAAVKGLHPVGEPRRAYGKGPLPWISLAHICRALRAAALHTPRFWSFLVVTTGQTFAALLPRSRHAPLTVYAYLDDDDEDMGSNDRLCALETHLPAHLYRLRELCVNGPLVQVQRVCKLLASPLDTLDTLVLSNRIYAPDFDHDLEPDVPVIAAPGLTSGLRHLQLQWLPFRWDDPVFATRPLKLNTLIVSAGDRDVFPDVGRLEDFMSTMEAAAPYLDVLRLEDVFPQKSPEGNSSSSHCGVPSKSISFPALSSLRLAGRTSDVLFALDHFSFSPDVVLDIVANGESDLPDLVHRLSEHLRRAAPLQAIEISLPYRPSDELRLSGWRDDIPHPPKSPPFQLSVNTHKDDTEEFETATALQHVGDTFAHIERLTITGNGTAQTWRDIYSRLPSVHRLVIAHGEWKGFLGPLTAAGDGAADSNTLAFPALRQLELMTPDYFYGGCQPTERSVDALLEWLGFRQARGAPIGSLCLTSWVVTEEEVQKLKVFVPDVRFEGIVDRDPCG
ncbi:hypothetical protein C8Q77DRAFT_1135682 [Trametes polyzona]|nr:hypothetical protein C8Q77DRAFT_1135682 [Trametes polyzona]